MALTEQIFNSICINQPVKEWSDVATKKTVFNTTHDFFLIMPTCKAIRASWEAVKPKQQQQVSEYPALITANLSDRRIIKGNNRKEMRDHGVAHLTS